MRKYTTESVFPSYTLDDNHNPYILGDVKNVRTIDSSTRSVDWIIRVKVPRT